MRGGKPIPSGAVRNDRQPPLIRHGLRRATFSRWEKVIPQKRHRAGEGSNELQCTSHALAGRPAAQFILTRKSDNHRKNDTERVRGSNELQRTPHALAGRPAAKKIFENVNRF